MFDKNKDICDVVHDLYPILCHKLAYFLRILPPLEHDMLYGRPITNYSDFFDLL